MGIALVMQDRRESKRLSLQVPVSISSPVGSEVPGLTRDISATGMLFHSTQDFAVGDQITVAFRIGGTQDLAVAHVVRCDDHVTAVRFERPSAALSTMN